MRALILAAVMLLAACQSKTEHGECLGAFDENDPRFVYKTSVQNVIVGAIFVETLIVPAVVVATEIKCPVSVRAPASSRSEGTRDE